MAVCVSDSVGVDVSDAVRDWVIVCEPVIVLDWLAVLVGVCVLDIVFEAVVENDWLTVAVDVSLAVRVAVCVGVSVIVGVSVGVLENVGAAEPVLDAVRARVALALAEDDSDTLQGIVRAAFCMGQLLQLWHELALSGQLLPGEAPHVVPSFLQQ